MKKPQIKGIIEKVYVMKPKKPNSALRKVCDVKCFGNKIIKAYIPGEGHNLTKYSTVLLRYGKVKDLTGVNMKVIRGVKDCKGVDRKTSRSKYGAKKSK